MSDIAPTALPLVPILAAVCAQSSQRVIRNSKRSVPESPLDYCLLVADSTVLSALLLEVDAAMHRKKCRELAGDEDVNTDPNGM